MGFNSGFKGFKKLVSLVRPILGYVSICQKGQRMGSHRVVTGLSLDYVNNENIAITLFIFR